MPDPGPLDFKFAIFIQTILANFYPKLWHHAFAKNPIFISYILQLLPPIFELFSFIVYFFLLLY